MKYCPYCGKQTDSDESVFCMKCGSRFPALPVNVGSSGMNVTFQPREKKPDNKKLIVIVSALAVLIVAVAVMFATGMFSGLQSGNDGQDTYSSSESQSPSENSTDKSGLAGLLSGISGDTGNTDKAKPAEPATTEPTPEVASTETPPPPAAGNGNVIGGNLVVWSSSDTIKQMIDKYVQPAFPDVQFQTAISTSDVYNEKLKVAIAAGVPPDVFTIDDPNAKYYIDNDLLFDLSDIEAEAKTSGMMNFVMDYGRDQQGVLRALAWQACPGAMFYRRSYAMNYLGADDPAVIQDMVSDPGKLLDFARSLDSASGGVCKLTSLNELNAPVLGSRTQKWVMDNHLTIDPALPGYLETYKSLRQGGLLADCTQWDPAWFESISNGGEQEIFSYFMPNWGLQAILKTSSINSTDNTDTSGDWAMIKGPYNYFWGGAWIAAAKDTNNEQAAKAVIQFMTTNADFLDSWTSDNHDITSNMPANERNKDQGVEPFLSGQNAFIEFNNIAENIDGFAGTYYDAQINTLWGTAVENYSSGAMSLDETLQTFKDGVSAAYPDIIVD